MKTNVRRLSVTPHLEDFFPASTTKSVRLNPNTGTSRDRKKKRVIVGSFNAREIKMGWKNPGVLDALVHPYETIENILKTHQFIIHRTNNLMKKMEIIDNYHYY